METMCIIQRGLLSKTEGHNMTSKEGHHGGGSQLDSNQIKGMRKNALSRLRALFQILSSICFSWKLLFLYTIAFILTHAHGEEQTGISKLKDPASIWDISSVVNFEAIGLCTWSSTMQFPMKPTNICIPHGHISMEHHSSGPLGPLSPSRANIKVVVTVLAIIGGIVLAGRKLYKHWRAFTEADINRGLMSEPAVPKRSNPTFEILPSID